MYYIIETAERLDRLLPQKKCFIEVITGNDKFHPLLVKVSLIYYRTPDKGYVFVIDHSEGLKLSLERVVEFLRKHKEVYCLDSKYCSYFVDAANLVDVSQIIVDEKNKLPELNCDSTAHTNYYREYPYLPTVNRLIPISKHYERCEQVYEKVAEYLKGDTKTDFYKELSKQYKIVEEQGLVLDSSSFGKYFEPSWQPYSVKDSKVFTNYNLYNLTGRPTNSFNNINFLALNKEDSSRKAFRPRNDLFVEFDFEGYHLRLIANLLNYKFDPKISIHTQLGREYFDKEDLTQEEYTASKGITFKQIYGGVQSKYVHIDFFKRIVEFIDELWDSYQTNGVLLLPTGRSLYKDKVDLNPQKLFNYYIQNLETYVNVLILAKLNALLAETRSKIVLVVYDSFLLDFAIEDGKETLLNIKKIIEEEGFTVKAKVGQDYHSLVKTDYL